VSTMPSAVRAIPPAATIETPVPKSVAAITRAPFCPLDTCIVSADRQPKEKSS
jgi:hypothetical protein